LSHNSSPHNSNPHNSSQEVRGTACPPVCPPPPADNFNSALLDRRFFNPSGPILTTNSSGSPANRVFDLILPETPIISRNPSSTRMKEN
jgi:hypothetical protein